MVEGEVPVISAGIAPSGYHIKANVKGTSLTISSSGANAGYLSIHYEDIWAADCMFITEENTKNIYYLYELLNIISPKNGQKIPKITNLQYNKGRANYGTKKKSIYG